MTSAYPPPINARLLQQRLGVGVDGILGIGSWTAFFKKLGAPAGFASDMAYCAAVYFPTYGMLDNAFRLIHFTGQCAHESGSFKYMEEIASGAAYEGRVDLGNTQPGDGVRFKGRGPIQTTGRGNYRKIGQQIGINLESNPTLLSNPSLGMHASLQFWKNMSLNVWADRDDAKACSRGVNRGNPQATKPANHEAERIALTNKVRVLVL